MLEEKTSTERPRLFDECRIFGGDEALRGDAARSAPFPRPGRQRPPPENRRWRVAPVENIGHVLGGLQAELAQFIALQPVAVALHLDRGLEIGAVDCRCTPSISSYFGAARRRATGGSVRGRQRYLSATGNNCGRLRSRCFRLAFAHEIHHIAAQGDDVAVDLLRGDRGIGHAGEAAEARFGRGQREIAEAQNGRQNRRGR